MCPILRVCLQPLAPLLCYASLLGYSASVHADPKPLTKEEQAKVDKAIDKGVRFLKQLQRPSGGFPVASNVPKPPPNMAVGYTLLPALALLECGVAPDDPSIQKVAALLRKRASKLENTYTLSLAIMFLDRLGERQDEELVQSLALRLIAGQSYTGGWTYRCPLLTADQERILLNTLRVVQDASVKGKKSPREAANRADAKRRVEVEIPASLAELAVFQNPEKLFQTKEEKAKDSILYVGRTDNSNTQFAMLGLWTARRHHLPLVLTFRLVVQRFALSQEDDGTWGYYYPHQPAHFSDLLKRTNTGVGLMALAIGRETVPEEKEAQARREKQIIKGLAVLHREIGDPSEEITKKSAPPQYYLLWTVERVAALYNLQTFGEKDWYRWGEEILIASQHSRGYWPPTYTDSKTNSYGFTVNTSFALLFLKRSNLVKDLTARLPFKPEQLNKGILALPAAVPSGTTSSSSQDSRRQHSSDLPP